MLPSEEFELPGISLGEKQATVKQLCKKKKKKSDVFGQIFLWAAFSVFFSLRIKIVYDILISSVDQV